MARWIARVSWTLVGLAAAWSVLFSGTDRASAILFAAALIVGGFAAMCGIRLIDARDGLSRLLWTGRALALLGAAAAIAFPGVLFQELLMIAARRPLGSDDWLVRGITQTSALIPLTVIPAIVSLRHARAGGLLFLVNVAVSVALTVYDPFAAFPERDVGGGLVFDGMPRLLTAVLLLAASTPTPIARPVQARA